MQVCQQPLEDSTTNLIGCLCNQNGLKELHFTPLYPVFTGVTMHPLYHALSWVGASERHQESKAVDTRQQRQTKAVGTSQQWTSPGSWHSYDTPRSDEPQASDSGPSGERKLLVHKSTRKVDESVPDTRQNLGRGNEPDGPQPNYLLNLAMTRYPLYRQTYRTNCPLGLWMKPPLYNEVVPQAALMGEHLALNQLLLNFSPISRRGRAQTIPLEALRTHSITPKDEQ